MDHHGSSISQYVPSSPPRSSAVPSSPSNPYLSSPTRSSRRKERRNPSVTPRRFGRFFTPRSSLPLPGRSILGSLDAASVNYRQQSSPQSMASDPLASDPILCSSPSERVSRAERREYSRDGTDRSEPVIKRRKVIPDDMPPPRLNLHRTAFVAESGVLPMDVESPSSLASQEKRKATLSQFFRASRSGVRGLPPKLLSDGPEVVPLSSNTPVTVEDYQLRPVRKFRNRGFEAQLLDREHGFASRPSKQHIAFPACDPRTETASFYSHSADAYHCDPLIGTSNTIPFSLASAHAAPVTAVGDESGFVRFFNTTESAPSAESKVDVSIRAHDNAIMGLDFSEDDLRLATACGDRTSKILDVATQTVAAELNDGHWDSLRQVSFQPGRANGSVIATSDRIGRVQIWDLRCSSAPVAGFSTHHGAGGLRQRDTTLAPFRGKTVNTLNNAHSRTVEGVTSPSSVTAIQWMPSGREHLLLTASEANASIKLWDSRYIKPRRQAEERPLAATPEPATHAWRSYGITSLTLSSDAARLYAVCKDSTVYAYSTSHLVLGHAPELVDGAIKRRPTGAEGLGPVYGFKHDMFGAQSFYVKSALRRSSPHGPELLAVGSSNNCAVLFPTDDRYMRSLWAQRAHLPSEPSSTSTSFSVAPTPSQSFTPSSLAPSSSPIPIFRNAGTPLIRGHSREVTVLSWSHEGKLVTASDDFYIRQWQEGRGGEARHLRQVGEFGGERHMAGWADVEPEWDVEDDEG